MVKIGMRENDGRMTERNDGVERHAGILRPPYQSYTNPAA
jgi:hypothetical protein